MLAALPRAAATWLVALSAIGGGLLTACLGQLAVAPKTFSNQPYLVALVPLLLAVAIVFGVRPVRLGPSTKIHLGAAPLFCAALLFAPALAGVIAYTSALSHNLWLRRRPWNALFNAAQHLLTAVGAGALYHAIQSMATGVPGAMAALAAAGLGYFLISTLLAATMTALAQRKSWLATVASTWRSVWAHYLTLLTFGWLAALVAVTAPWSLPLLAVPILVAYRLDQTLGDLLDTRRQLAEALERQRQFVGDVAHELGAPLTSVAGNAAVLLADTALAPTLREPVEDMFAEATRTARLLGDLLLLSKVEEGRPLQRTAVSLCCVAEEAIRLCRSAASTGDVCLELQATSDGWVDGSQELLEQLLINLVENAIHHSAPESRVQVTVALLDGQLAVAVRDSGSGIPAEELAQVFQRHYRAGKAQSRALGGAGLGLAIARRIADVHGGHITAESTVGAGSCFTLLLPPGAEPGGSSRTVERAGRRPSVGQFM
jgi:signal transduction histidine kinase